ncbi:MAG: lysophospholipid acyltransferase family protein [Bacteroidales bacterium]|nr:lysophospholipid acyltransferase family protein [Bacteroidales bacterium]
MNLLGAFTFFCAVVFFGLFPFPLLYLFSYVVRFFLYGVFGYRKAVVVENLKGSFPSYSAKEIKRLTNLFYKNLVDIILEGIRAFTMSRRQILKRHRITNPELLEEFYKKGQSVIVAAGHYCNWEWGSLSASLQTKFNVVAFYKPLSNGYVDRFVRWSRSRFGTTLAPIKDTSLTFENCRDIRTIYLMAGDQGMPKEFMDRAYWVQFLNRETAFLHGMEKHARLNNLPVLYADIQRLKRGYYVIEFSILTQQPLELEEGVLTEMYARKLESIILKKPENWLWSHRRWKHSRD